MSESFYDELEGLIGKHRQAEKEAATEEANEARFKRLEDAVGGIGSLIDERLPKKDSSQQSNSEDSREEKGEDESTASDEPSPQIPEELAVERVGKFTVPKIYTGDDEPDIVEYIDADSGDKMTRKGRKRNRPTTVDVRPVEPEPNEITDIPQEPDEANG